MHPGIVLKLLFKLVLRVFAYWYFLKFVFSKKKGLVRNKY